MEKTKPKFSKIKSPKKPQNNKKVIRNSEQNKIRSNLLILTNNEIIPYKKNCSVLINNRSIKDISKDYQITLIVENPFYFGNSTSNTKQNQPKMFDFKSKSNRLKYFNLNREANNDKEQLFLIERSKAKEKTAIIYQRDNNIGFNFNSKVHTMSHSISPVKKKSEKKLQDFISEYNNQIKIRRTIMNNIDQMRKSVADRKLHKQHIDKKISCKVISQNKPWNIKIKRAQTITNIYQKLKEPKRDNSYKGEIFLQLISQARQLKNAEFIKNVYESKEERSSKNIQQSFNKLNKLADSLKTKKYDFSNFNFGALKSKPHSEEPVFPIEMLSICDLKEISFTPATPFSSDSPSAKFIFTTNQIDKNKKINFKYDKNNLKSILNNLQGTDSIFDSPKLKRYINDNKLNLEIQLEANVNDGSSYEERNISRKNSSSSCININNSIITEGFL
jgi:hypothetical protein